MYILFITKKSITVPFVTIFCSFSTVVLRHAMPGIGAWEMPTYIPLCGPLARLSVVKLSDVYFY